MVVCVDVDTQCVCACESTPFFVNTRSFTWHVDASHWFLPYIMEVKSHLGQCSSSCENRGKFLKTVYLKEEITGFHIRQVDASYLVYDPHCFWWGSKVI